MDYRRMYDDKEMLYSYDLEEFGGQDAVFQIKSVQRGEVTGNKGRKNKMPFVSFHDPENRLGGKRLGINKTNGKSIAKMYTRDADKWPGQWIAMFVSTTNDPETGDVVPCIRIRPQRPDVQRTAQNGKNTRRFSKEEVEAARHEAADALVVQFDGCDDAEMFAALEEDRKREWGVMGKDDKLRVKAAAEKAHRRILDVQHEAATVQVVPEQAEPAAEGGS